MPMLFSQVSHPVNDAGLDPRVRSRLDRERGQAGVHEAPPSVSASQG